MTSSSRPPMPPPEPIAVLPDRPLDLPRELPTIAVRTGALHPFLFRKMVIGPVGKRWPFAGELVRIASSSGEVLGYGLWNGHSQIAIRVLQRGVEPPGPAYWAERLDQAVRLRREILKLDEATNAYRVVHAEGDGLSGLIVDRFGDVLSIEAFSLGIYQRVGALVELLSARLGTTHARVAVDDMIAQAEDFPGRPAATANAPDRVTIHEHEIRYRVRFEGGHKTGFFCDQRDNRRDLARFCDGRSVLDLCCYTGGFALNALIRGPAKDVTAVDLDEKAIAVAKENANLNQVRLGLVHADAFGYARQMIANGRSYGAVVLDPPKLIANRDEVSAGKRRYFDLNVLAMGVVEPGGLLLTCSCSGLLPLEDFVYLLRAAARKAGRAARILAITGAGADHPVALDALEGSYLKAVWLQMGERVNLPDDDAKADQVADVSD